MNFSLSEFLAGSTTLFLVTKLFEWLKRLTSPKIDLAQNIKDIQQIHILMEDIVKNTCYDRFILFMAEDSAGVIAAGKNMYVTAQYEKLHQEEDHNIESILSKINRWKADSEYYSIFSDMLTKGYVDLVTAEMPKSNLKDIYISQGVVRARVYHLMTTKNSHKVFYCSVATTMNLIPTEDDRAQITGVISQLTDIFSRHAKFY